MKKIVGLAFVAVLAAFSLTAADVNAQSLACCKPGATQAFALLASHADFRAAHEAPLPFTLENKKGAEIHFKTPDGKEGHGYEVKADRPSRNYLFVFQEWWGLNDYIRQMSDKLQEDIGDINVIAVDLYDGKVAANPDEAARYMQGVKDERARAIIQGAINYAGRSARIYTIGWCFGGGWSLQASLMAGNQADGCVMYYGLPEDNLARLKALHADVLGIFANKDGWITPKVVDEFAANMKKEGKKLIVHRYDADHGFANPSSPKHDEAATKQAYAYTLAFFRQRVK